MLVPAYMIISSDLTMSSKTKERKTRKRYSDAEKAEITEFVTSHDAENGRGGKSAAVKKYGIAPLSLVAWLKQSSNPTPSGKKRGRKPGSKNVAAPVTNNDSFLAKIKELTAVSEQIDKLSSHLDLLREQFQAIKATL